MKKTGILASVLTSAIYLEVAPFALVAGGDAALYYTQAAFSRFHSKMAYCNALMLAHDHRKQSSEKKMDAHTGMMLLAAKAAWHSRQHVFPMHEAGTMRTTMEEEISKVAAMTN